MENKPKVKATVNLPSYSHKVCDGIYYSTKEFSLKCEIFFWNIESLSKQIGNSFTFRHGRIINKK